LFPLLIWAETFPWSPRSKAKINAGKTYLQRMIRFLSNSKVESHPYSISSNSISYQKSPSIVFIGLVANGIASVGGLCGSGLLNFHTTMQVVTVAKPATMAVEVDDNLPF